MLLFAIAGADGVVLALALGLTLATVSLALAIVSLTFSILLGVVVEREG